MCTQYFVIDDDPEMLEIINEINRRYGDSAEKERMAKGSIFPLYVAPALAADGPRPIKWGFPPVHGNKKPVVNARQETAATSPYFKKALMANRIAIPTSGFFEWSHDAATKKAIDKYRFNLPGETMLYLAGICESFALPGGKKEDRFAILTTEANGLMRGYHDRMPVYLKKEGLDDWFTDRTCMEDILHRTQPTLAAVLAGPPKPVQMSLF